jgi:hypothetical protein
MQEQGAERSAIARLFQECGQICAPEAATSTGLGLYEGVAINCQNYD